MKRFVAVSAFCLLFLGLGVPGGYAQKKDFKEFIHNQWVLQELAMEGKRYDETALQSRSGINNILEFVEGGKCYIKSKDGRILQRNLWQFVGEDGRQLLISSEEEGDSQTYQVEELKAKKLTLSMKDGDKINFFVYKLLKVN